MSMLGDRTPDWSRAHCRADNTGLGLWDERGAQETHTEFFGRVREAQDVCGACPIRATCYAYGVESHSHGVWGGELLKGGRLTSLSEPQTGECPVCSRPRKPRPRTAQLYKTCGSKECQAEMRHRAWMSNYRAGTPLGKVKPHGTVAAYRRHQRYGEYPCDECARADSLARGSMWTGRRSGPKKLTPTV